MAHHAIDGCHSNAGNLFQDSLHPPVSIISQHLGSNNFFLVRPPFHPHLRYSP